MPSGLIFAKNIYVVGLHALAPRVVIRNVTSNKAVHYVAEEFPSQRVCVCTNYSHHETSLPLKALSIFDLVNICLHVRQNLVLLTCDQHTVNF